MKWRQMRAMGGVRNVHWSAKRADAGEQTATMHGSVCCGPMEMENALRRDLEIGELSHSKFLPPLLLLSATVADVVGIMPSPTAFPHDTTNTPGHPHSAAFSKSLQILFAKHPFLHTPPYITRRPYLSKRRLLKRPPATTRFAFHFHEPLTPSPPPVNTTADTAVTAVTAVTDITRALRHIQSNRSSYISAHFYLLHFLYVCTATSLAFVPTLSCQAFYANDCILILPIYVSVVIHCASKTYRAARVHCLPTNLRTSPNSAPLAITL